MRTLSLALALTTTLLACSGDDEPAPPADQPAALVAPATPAPAAGGDDDQASVPAPAGDTAAKDEKKDDEKDETNGEPAGDPKDEAAFGGLAQTLNECLKASQDADGVKSCLSDFQASLPQSPGTPAGSSMCCAGGAFFVCHSADGEDATCNADNPGDNCQNIPAMDVICKAKGDD